MAVFFENVCKFGKCGKIFPTLTHLIIHIEDTHISKLAQCRVFLGNFFAVDYDALIPQHNNESTNVPLSYILKYQSTANDNIITEIKEEAALLKQANNLPKENIYTQPRKLSIIDFIVVFNKLFTEFGFTENELCESESSCDSLTVEEAEVTVKK